MECKISLLFTATKGKTAFKEWRRGVVTAVMSSTKILIWYLCAVSHLFGSRHSYIVLWIHSAFPSGPLFHTVRCVNWKSEGHLYDDSAVKSWHKVNMAFLCKYDANHL